LTSFVEPSTSLNRNVTVPLGRLAMITHPHSHAAPLKTHRHAEIQSSRRSAFRSGLAVGWPGRGGELRIEERELEAGGPN
jgi:hypothetical protein